MIFLYGYAYWRILPREEKENFSRALYTMGKEIADKIPLSPTGYMIQTAATGLSVLTAGVLNALHLLPIYRKNLQEAINRKPDYFWGLPYILLGAMYLKAPPFPLSIGDLAQAESALRKAEPLSRRKYAFWYIFYIEYLYLSSGIDKAREYERELLREVVPPTSYLAYIWDTAVVDVKNFFSAVKENRYDKYLYSPLLEIPTSSGEKPPGL
jgi:tetratricopeptide (TPR) repeat protein